jgi:hypothetical protein
MTEPRVYTIELPAGMQLINANDRFHWRTKAHRTQNLRQITAILARNAGIPRLERVHIVGWYHPPNTRRRDAANWYPTFKACVDGCVDAGVIDDDDTAHVTGPDMRIGHTVKRGQIVLEIRELTDTSGRTA